MIRLRLHQITYSYPSKPILQEASCEIQKGCYGVVGPNGSGKTTLLKLIADELKPDSGVIMRGKELSISYMPQDVDLDPETIAIEIVRQSASRILLLENRLKEIERKFADPDYFTNEKRLARLIELQEKVFAEYTQLGGAGLESRIQTLLAKIGFEDHDMLLPVRSLSGGQKKLLALARIIINRPDILLLDEPDNHLDLAGKAMLQRLIEVFEGSVVIVSHDRYFLDIIVDEILEVENGRIIQSSGTYSEFIFGKHRRLERQYQRYLAQQKEINRLEQAAKRLLMWGKVHDNEKFSNRGKNILKRLEKMDVIDKPNLDKAQMEINLSGWRGSQKVLEITNLAKGFPKPGGGGIDQILQNINLSLRYGDRVGMIGPNGAGKSLLIRLILGQMQPDAGEIYLGPSIIPGYYAQEFETLDPDLGLLETICKAGNFSENKGVTFLRKFLFTYHQRDTLICDLSGGERARLQIALITLSGANFLLLDEPTNHLDIPSCEILEDTLLDFDGTILTVSHDRYFLDRITDRIVELMEYGLEEYQGNYSDYESHKLAAKGAAP